MQYHMTMQQPFPILVVEDDATDFFLLKRALEKNGIDNPIHWIRDGLHAIDYLQGVGAYADREQHPLPKVIILDLKMPRLGGLELLDWIKSHPELSILPVLVMSSSNLPDDVERAYALGASSFFMKPSTFEDLQKMTKSIHEYWVQCVEPQLPRRTAPRQTSPSADLANAV